MGVNFLYVLPDFPRHFRGIRRTTDGRDGRTDRGRRRRTTATDGRDGRTDGGRRRQTTTTDGRIFIKMTHFYVKNNLSGACGNNIFSFYIDFS